MGSGWSPVGQVSTLDDKLVEVSRARERAKADAEEASRRVREAAAARAANIAKAASGV
jgi:hypothetical protein